MKSLKRALLNTPLIPSLKFEDSSQATPFPSIIPQWECSFETWGRVGRDTCATPPCCHILKAVRCWNRALVGRVLSRTANGATNTEWGLYIAPIKMSVMTRMPTTTRNKHSNNAVSLFVVQTRTDLRLIFGRGQLFTSPVTRLGGLHLQLHYRKTVRVLASCYGSQVQLRRRNWRPFISLGYNRSPLFRKSKAKIQTLFFTQLMHGGPMQLTFVSWGQFSLSASAFRIPPGMTKSLSWHKSFLRLECYKTGD